MESLKGADKSDKSVTSSRLPGFAVTTETAERKRPIESWRKERNSLVCFCLFCFLY